mgnify:CR=1 FL=1
MTRKVYPVDLETGLPYKPLPGESIRDINRKRRRARVRELSANGVSIKAIALRLHISQRTVYRIKLEGSRSYGGAK